MSNPTSLSECTAEQVRWLLISSQPKAYKWTNGRAVFASGSPFPPTEFIQPDGSKTVFTSRQAVIVRNFRSRSQNNMFIFPGVGLAVVGALTPSVPDRFFFEAARTLASCVDATALAQGQVYIFLECLFILKVFPSTNDIRKVSLEIAVAVARAAEEEGLVCRRPSNGNWCEVHVSPNT